MSKFVEQAIAIADDVVQELSGPDYVHWDSTVLRKHLEAREAVTADLLEALQTLLPMFKEWHEAFPLDVGDKEAPALGRARAAIAKAEGSQHG